jgi:hypothetical protein
MIDISKITDYLYVGSRIGEEHADEIKLLKFDLIISMIAQEKLHDVYLQAPFNSLWIATYDNFLRPISVDKFLKGVNAALPVIEKKGKVLVFCMQGRRRSVAMASAILIALGHTSGEAAELLIKNRSVATPHWWYIKMQIRHFENYWHRHHQPGKGALHG